MAWVDTAREEQIAHGWRQKDLSGAMLLAGGGGGAEAVQ